ncbi:radical SAM protein [Microseira sp. BLCC-F43]|jgi:oxygen-independent coproporphyrinogen-3 oxidase|uniref:radical SAM protein n=1 Tax=Microseira sp. BLCC-F43 TaxID=3153602 RepID=UPI0035B86E26
MLTQEVLRSFLGPPGAYLHIPFCRSICPFCPYNKIVYQPELVRRYFMAVEEEVTRYVKHLEAPFTSLYIGGGTPTLCLDELSSLVAKIPVKGERAMEILPTHATGDRLDQIEKMGITFISLGVQSFNADMLRHLKRPNSVLDNQQALDRVAGRFACVDIDLIFDVAFEDETVFLHDLETCFIRGADQVSTYPLMRFGYTPFGKGGHDRRQEHILLHKAEELASRYGYERRSVWTFNRKQAPNYTSITRPFYLGLGAGSASYTGRLFLVNHFSIDRYIEKVQAGELPIARTVKLSAFPSSAYALFWQLYTGSIDTDALADRFGTMLAMGWRTLFSLLAWANYLEKDDNVFILTPKGRDRYHDLEQWVTYHFIEPLWAEMMQEHRISARAQNGAN